MENDFGTPFYETVRINDEFKNIIKSGNYEELILKLMNKSTKLFPNNYERVISQSHGECDFIDLKTFEKYDAKLLLNKKQGNWLGSKNSNFEKWIQSMIDEIADYSEIIKDRKWDEEIEKIVLSAIDEIKPTSMKDMGLVMKKVGELLVGKNADMSLVSKLVKEKIMSN